MQIKNLCVKNKYVDLQNVSLDFSQNGIYLIKGKNGSGKTTLMEKIVFGENDVFFDSDEMYREYKENRFNLFTYIPQNVTDSRQKVYDYITKDNGRITIDKIRTYFIAFELDSHLLEVPFFCLSGGEKMKISIISGLLKDTAYVFMDEPTNNLDNGSVELLKKILKGEALQKRIILISHDKRLDVEARAEYDVERQRIKCMSTHVPNGESKILLGNNNKPAFLKLACRLSNNFAQVVTIAIATIFLTVLISFSHFFLLENYSVPEPIKENLIYAYMNSPFDSDELNGIYVKGEKLSIAEEKYEKGTSYEDIGDIANIKGVQDVYLEDIEYLDSLNEKVYYGTAKDSLNLYSCPQILYEELYETYKVGDLGIASIDGRAPRDYADEVALSKRILIDHFGYEEKRVNTAIGETIRIDLGEGIRNYKIVGFCYYDIVMISYEKNHNYGFYCYDSGNYSDFKEKQVGYAQEIDAIDESTGAAMIENIAIVTKAGCEREVLNTLFLEYPGQRYNSSHYGIVWAKTYNINQLAKLLFVNVIVSLLLAVAMYFVNRNSLKYNVQLIWDYENYYINKKKIQRVYRGVLLGEYLVLALVLLAINCFFSEYSFLTNYYLIVDAVIIFAPIAGLCIVKKKF